VHHVQNCVPIRRGPIGSLARFIAVAGLVGLAAPATAQAHGRSAVVAIDYRVAIQSAPTGIEARVLDGDRKLWLEVDRGLTVVVLGYANEPFLRFSPSGVEINDRAPTAWSDRLARGASPAFDARASPSWRLTHHGHSFSWHEHRLAPPLHIGQIARWTVPLVVDGRPTAVSGTVRKVARPPFWPWLALGALFLFGGVVLLRRSSPTAARHAAFLLAWAAGAAAYASVVGVALAGAVGRSQAAELVPASALALIGVGALLFWRSGRQIAVGAIATLALSGGLGLLPVFAHAVVISALPAVAARTAAAIAVWGGATALLLIVLDGVVWDTSRRGRHAGARA
jgi:hypothetical protein